MMDYFAYLIANKSTSTQTVKVRKIYINEDPAEEVTAPCPSCTERNQSSNVRYMYVNLQEAIYKCESPSCMYPFRNFKFKNYTDNTVYSYASVEEATPLAAVLDDFGPSFTNVLTTSPSKIEPSAPQMNESSTIDFNLSFFSPERSSMNDSISKAGHNTSLNIFGSPTLSYKNLVQDFDTGFIDDILQDLGKSASPEKPKPVLVSPVRTVVQSKSCTAGRQLKRCLQMLEDNAAPSSEATFKVPPLPGLEIPSPPKVKPKKYSPLRRSKHNRRMHASNSGLPPEKLIKKRHLTPLEFIETVNSLQSKEAESNLAAVKPSKNRRVENMLNFIERSLKNRQPKPPDTVPPSPPKHSAKRPPVLHRTPKKTSKRMSLSAAVLHDSQFEYSTSESEQEDPPPAPPPPSKIRIPSPLKLDDFSCGSTSLGSLTPSQDDSSSQSSLPSFEDLLQHIHPGASGMVESHPPSLGFRSAGCSPTREPQWAQTPPRRIHSMESLCGLLE